MSANTIFIRKFTLPYIISTVNIHNYNNYLHSLSTKQTMTGHLSPQRSHTFGNHNVIMNLMSLTITRGAVASQWHGGDNRHNYTCF